MKTALFLNASIIIDSIMELVRAVGDAESCLSFQRILTEGRRSGKKEADDKSGRHVGMHQASKREGERSFETHPNDRSITKNRAFGFVTDFTTVVLVALFALIVLTAL